MNLFIVTKPQFRSIQWCTQFSRININGALFFPHPKRAKEEKLGTDTQRPATWTCHNYTITPEVGIKVLKVSVCRFHISKSRINVLYVSVACLIYAQQIHISGWESKWRYRTQYVKLNLECLFRRSDSFLRNRFSAPQFLWQIRFSMLRFCFLEIHDPISRKRHSINIHFFVMGYVSSLLFPAAHIKNCLQSQQANWTCMCEPSTRLVQQISMFPFDIQSLKPHLNTSSISIRFIRNQYVPCLDACLIQLQTLQNRQLETR